MKTVRGWKKGILGEECSIEIGGTPSRNVPEYWDDSKITANLWVSIRDLNHRVIIRTTEHISDSGVKHSNVKLQPEGTILLSFKLTIGRVAVAGRPLYTNEAIAGLRSETIDHQYLYHGLQQWDLLQGVDQAIKGATLNKAKLKEIKFDYPDAKPEQVKIAEILSTLDRAIEQMEALIAKQQRIKTGLVQDLLTRGIDKHGNLRSESTHKFKDSPLGRVPVEWEVDKLSSRALVKGGKRLPAGHAYAEGDTGCRYLRTTDFIRKRLNYPSLNCLFPSTFRLLERYEILSGDIFISIAGVNLGTAGVFRPDFTERTILTENAAKIRFVTDEHPEYVAIQLNGPVVQQQIIEAKGVGAGVPKLALFRIQQLQMCWPTNEEQMQIVRRLAHFENCIMGQEGTLAKHRALKTALMHDLLTGNKRVTLLLEPAHTP